MGVGDVVLIAAPCCPSKMKYLGTICTIIDIQGGEEYCFKLDLERESNLYEWRWSEKELKLPKNLF